MLNFFVLILSLTFSSIAFSGSSTVDCFTKYQAVNFSVGNGSNTIQIKYKENSNDKEGVYEAPIKLMPDFDYGAEINKKTISAFPIATKKIIFEEDLVMHVTHRDGTSCYGRQSWNTNYTQELIITGNDGTSLKNWDVLLDKEVVNMSEEGYVIATFYCHAYGVTTAGGCYAEEGDTVVWEKY